MAYPKLKLIALAWPMCRMPLGSGGNRVMIYNKNKKTSFCQIKSQYRFYQLFLFINLNEFKHQHCPSQTHQFTVQRKRVLRICSGSSLYKDYLLLCITIKSMSWYYSIHCPIPLINSFSNCTHQEIKNTNNHFSNVHMYVKSNLI